MDGKWQQKVRERAYATWVQERRPEGQGERHWLAAEADLHAGEVGNGAACRQSGHRWTEAEVDEAVDETFPASDPPAWMP